MSDNKQLARADLKTVKGILEAPQFHAQVARVLPKHLTADRMIRVAITATMNSPALLECTPESLTQCLLTCSALGLEPDGRRAHLIPYGKKCTLIIDYKGLAELAMRSGLVSSLHADVVCGEEEFVVDCGRVSKHTIDYRKPRGEAYAAYAVCRFKDGSEKTEVMVRDEIEAIRKRSKSGGSGPWVSDWKEMAKKTVFRRLSKWLPLSPEFRDAVDADDDRVEEIDVTPRRPAGRTREVVEEPVAVLPEAQDENPDLPKLREWMASQEVTVPDLINWLNQNYYTPETMVSDLTSLDDKAIAFVRGKKDAILASVKGIVKTGGGE